MIRFFLFINFKIHEDEIKTSSACGQTFDLCFKELGVVEVEDSWTRWWLGEVVGGQEMMLFSIHGCIGEKVGRLDFMSTDVVDSYFRK